MNVDVHTFGEIISAVQNAEPDEPLVLRVKNDIVFSGAVLLNRSMSVRFINDSGNESVALEVVGGGSFRHFSTGAASVNHVLLTFNTGIILSGGGTGGGIAVFGSDCQVTLDGCVVTNCMSGGNGGGVLVQGNASRSRFVMNHAVIENCRSSAAGAGVFASDCDVEMNDGRITGNTAVTLGGGIQTMAGANRLGSSLAIHGGKIIGNAAVAPLSDGGGINAYDTVVIIEDGEISGNSADNYGGGIHIKSYALTANENALIIKGSSITGNRTRNTGGGIGVETAIREFTITNCAISDNKAVSEATGTKQGGGIYEVGGSTLIISDSRVTQNEAGSSGGGIFVNLSSLTVKGGTLISENDAAITGGGIYGYQGSAITLEEGAKVVNNYARCGNDPENSSRGGGGVALLSYGYVSTLNVKSGAIIEGNTSVSYGGGIWTYPGYGPENIVNIEGGTVKGNAANYGGGISMGAISGYRPVLLIGGGTISGNIAHKDGGGIMAMGSAVTVSDSRITGNIAGRDGGGIYTDALANVSVSEDSAFEGNSAGSYAYWTVDSGGDSDIHRTHIFTNRFSAFIPSQTPPPQVWLFSNAYNNYDINYVQPQEIITVVFTDASNRDRAIHSIAISSFIGATLTISPRDMFTDIDGTVWVLQPPGQPPQSIQLIDPDADYAVTFSYAARIGAPSVTVTRYFVDECGRQIAQPSRTSVEYASSYRATARVIENYLFVGFSVDGGPLQTGEVYLAEIVADTDIIFVYRRNCDCICRACAVVGRGC